MSSLHESMNRDGLVRPLEGRVLGGVCAGIGRRLGIDPWPARLLFVLLLMVLPGSQLLVYPILWIVMPSETRTPHPYGYPGATAYPQAPTGYAAPPAPPTA
jgi:phage shock protein PspC (stress-responsive transcriptional regulator)